jgi:hypothetical protein
MTSISDQLERLWVVPMESTIPPEMTIAEWRRSDKVVPLPPTQCDHLHEQTSRYDPVEKQVTCLTVCPVCRVEQVVETQSYEPRFEPHAASDSGGGTVHRLPVREYGGIALLQESAAERHVAPGVRFVPLEAGAPAFESAVLTRPDTNNLATAGFLRALTRASRQPDAPARRPEIALA